MPARLLNKYFISVQKGYKGGLALMGRSATRGGILKGDGPGLESTILTDRGNSVLIGPKQVLDTTRVSALQQNARTSLNDVPNDDVGVETCSGQVHAVRRPSQRVNTSSVEHPTRDFRLK